MSKRTTLEERIDIMELAQQGLTDRQIANQLELSVGTVRKWRRQSQRLGRKGLVSAMGRPVKGAMSSYPPTIADTVRRWRVAHPGWGAKSLQTEMQIDSRLKGQRLPSSTTIGRFLQEQGLCRGYQRHSRLPENENRPGSVPHALWEMDARGYGHIPDVGIVSLINLNDRFSHLHLLSYPCLLGCKQVERHATTADYQVALRLAFTEWGLPEALQVDHESVFFDNLAKSPFPTQLHLWLLALGIPLTFSRMGRPTDQGMTERSHQTWDAQALRGQRYDQWLDLYRTLRQRRNFLNEHFPSGSLAGQAPLQAFPQAKQSSRPYRPEWEKAMLDLQLVWAYLAQGRWFRLVSTNGTLSLGGSVYYIGHQWTRHQLQLTFDPSDQQFVCLDEKEQPVKRFPIKNLSVESLMGELTPFVALPEFQLILPFSWESQRVVRLFDSLGV